MSFNLIRFLPSFENVNIITLFYVITIHVFLLTFFICFIAAPDIYKETMKQLYKTNNVENLTIINYNAELNTYSTCRAIRDYLNEEHENNHFVRYMIFPKYCLNVR